MFGVFLCCLCKRQVKLHSLNTLKYKSLNAQIIFCDKKKEKQVAQTMGNGNN